MSFEDARKAHRVNLFRHRFNGKNYNEWMKALREALQVEGRLYILDNPPNIYSDTKRTDMEIQKMIRDEYETMYLILSSVSHEFTEEIMYLPSKSMIQNLQERFLPSRWWRFEILKEISKPLKSEGDVGNHIDRLVDYFARLEKLEYPVSIEMSLDFILCSLPKEYAAFVKSYNNNIFGGTVSDLKAMLLEEEERIKAKRKKRAFTEGHGDCTSSSRLNISDEPGSSGTLLLFNLLFIAKF